MRQRLRAGDQDGFTLVELIVAMAVGLLVIAMITGGLILVLGHQRRVVDTGQSSAEIQAAFTSIQRGVRNTTSDGAKVAGSGNVLVVFTGGGDTTNTWRCQAWQYMPGPTAGDAGTLYTRYAPQGTKLDAVTNPKSAGWTVAVQHVSLTSGRPAFSLAADGSVKLAMVASRTGNPDDIEAVRMDTQVVRLPQGRTGNGGCFS